MEKGYELIITEKPKVSQRVAQALATGPVKQEKKGKVSYYIIERDSKKIIVAAAVGHVFTLTQAPGAKNYPIFDIHWTPSCEVGTSSKFTKPYVEVIKQLAKNAVEFTAACDYDIEGELIGYNIIKFLCGEEALKKAKRMKFSALTEAELVKSYEGRLDHLDFNLAEAGITRHMLDWYWGINTSRALSHAYKSLTGRYATLSAGRVQTPTLKVLDDREKEIKAFIPAPFWVISALLDMPEKELLAIHETDKFFEKQKAINVYEKCNGKDAIVSEIQKKKLKQAPPTPFNLGDLQSESYRVFRYSPKRTQMHAQNLYEQGVISYPRTSSQKLPQGVKPAELIEKLKAQPKYKELAEEALKQTPLKANEGKKTDPAHPCIHPTGEIPKKITEQDAKLYDLIVKRFLACFGKPAIRETQEVKFKISDETFVSKGAVTLEENWHLFYKPYVRLKEEELPALAENQSVPVKKLDNEEKETQPPKRYSQAGIIKKMEQLGIGTKATRANILQTLYDRNYVEDKQIKVTDFGSQIVETIEKFVPELASADLTQKFEDEVEQIKEGSRKSEAVLEEAKETLIETSEKFRAHAAEIGERLVESHQSAEKKQRTLAKCPKCEKGDLIIRRSKASGKQFVGCSAYPNCDCSYPLPQNAKIVNTDKPCQHDGLPVIEVIRKGKRKFSMCIDPKCKSKETWGQKKKTTPQDKS